MAYLTKLSIKSYNVDSNSISNVIGLQPNIFLSHWELEEIHESEFESATLEFCKILKLKIEGLENIGVNRDEVSINILYVYNHQCNLEISPFVMKKIGELGVNFFVNCISY